MANLLTPVIKLNFMPPIKEDLGVYSICPIRLSEYLSVRKNINLGITFEQLELGFSYFTGLYLVTIPSFGYQNFNHLTFGV